MKIIKVILLIIILFLTRDILRAEKTIFLEITSYFFENKSEITITSLLNSEKGPYREVVLIYNIDNFQKQYKGMEDKGDFNYSCVISLKELLEKVNQPLIYKIKKGDTLYKIAKKFYKDGSKWEKIVKLNSIKNPNKIITGRDIKIELDEKEGKNFIYEIKVIDAQGLEYISELAIIKLNDN